ncbi:sensor histidine kinase N-terminal domain-containing protein [Mameliella sp. AT18]|uniref:sensor histidine kinase n=1 Tax=Mameliella sp. AT18 TaxID=3028385 RepID=UPI00084113DB|nr:sensor histidine kinase [Mameliella sp. AT18]MDD9730269.1 sensor histidine kinase N-terminal domain-containing protein [Mameliella sp. AT18]ODM49579.1 histidine kinase [Ruegeria sp. PBVC088]
MAEARIQRSLVARVLGAVLLILLLGGLLVTVSTWWNGRQAARQSYDRILLGAASDIAESIRIQNGAPFVDLPVSAFELLAQAPEDRIYYAVRGPDGTFITGLDETSAIAAPGRAGIAPGYFDAPLQGEPARFVQVTRRFAEREYSGSVEVIVGQTLRARQDMTARLVRDALWPMGVAGVVLLVMSWFVIRSALRPLEAISVDLALRDPNDLTPIPVDRLPRELQVMLGAMNRFMGRLDRQVDAMRNLISDTAHQLRTPVAAIRVQAEAAQAETGNEGADRALGRLLARSRSLSKLLDQLLSRAMVIHRTDSAPRRPVDLREIALEIIERDEHQALAPGAEVRLDISDAPVMVLADAFSLGEAAKNLLANALRHGKAPVTIGADQSGKSAAIWVRDSGPGPGPEIAQRLGDRFNRDRASGEASTGLGLSIVTSVAAAFGGSVEMARDDKGFRAALVLPAAPGEAEE